MHDDDHDAEVSEPDKDTSVAAAEAVQLPVEEQPLPEAELQPPEAVEVPQLPVAEQLPASPDQLSH